MTAKLTSSRGAQGVVLGFLFLAACSTTQPAEVPPQTQRGLVELRDKMVSGKAQIQKTTDAARDLAQRPLAEIVPQIDRLANEVRALEDMATQTRGQYAAQTSMSKQYFAAWGSQIETMSKEVREAGMQRHEQALASFGTLEKEVDSLRSTFRPYMEALGEATKYLRTDPTPTGVKSITPRIEGALGVEKELMEKIDAVISRIDSMRGSK